ncbi:hypothetical protein [Hymenobacter pini]|uniref:hypothetical protein n=1 Tax=Hymenobacter pini TaxID=2880879 RepID=UPI001CF4D124|nr:hypothetical protein [Hymenobacter pini]MCA8830286.1 hypothetical protein [Hymenobacter pini]
MAGSLVLADGQRLPLSEDSRVALTLQANNILQAASVQADFSSTVMLPDSPEVRAALEQAQRGTALTELPYQQLPCTLEVGGRELLPGAVAIVEQHTTGTGFEAQVIGGNKSFYAALEGKKLRDLTFPAVTEHDWVLASAVAGAAHTQWRQSYCYDLYDRGKGGPAEGSTVHLFESGMLPSVYARAVWEQVFAEAGFRWSGLMPELLDRLLLPTAVAPGYGEEFRKARKLVAGISGQRPDYGRAYEGRPEVVRTVPFDYTDARYGYQAPTAALVWNPATYSWKALEPCYVNVGGSTTVELSSPFGSAQAQLFLYKNGGEVGGGPVVESKKGADSTWVTATCSGQRLLLEKGDELTLRIKLNKAKQGIYGTHKWGYSMFDGQIHVVDGNTLPLDSFTVEVLPDFPPGGRVRVQDLLPDIAQKDFVKGIVGLFGLTQQTDPYTRFVRFTPTGPALEDALPSAPNWQGKADAQAEAPRYFHLPDTAQRNWFRWKEDDTNPEAARGLGDGFLPCPNTTLESERDLLTLPWAATTTGTNGLPLLPVFSLRTGSVSVEPEYDKASPGPRLVVQSALTRRVLLTDSTAAGTAISPRISTFLGLNFTTDLLPAWYGHLRAVYARPLLLRPSVRLSVAEVTDFDQLQPVWLETEGSYFYCNKIDQWEEGQPSTRVDLLRLTY